MASNLTFTLNVPIELKAFQKLSINGEGAQNGAGNITVTILITTNRITTAGATSYRQSRRVHVGDYGSFVLGGVFLIESANDPLPSTPSSANKALFNTSGRGIIQLSQIRITTTEDVINFGEWADDLVRSGWTYITVPADFTNRIVYPVIADSGSNFRGHGGVVARSHTFLTGLNWDTSSRILYRD
ncbi:MAG: hypothetical protein GKR87_01305 [Kiritimatiellae bacterium]|nr:hypothetical protein [Kiritimatiellia bacterium]